MVGVAVTDDNAGALLLLLLCIAGTMLDVNAANDVEIDSASVARRLPLWKIAAERAELC